MAHGLFGKERPGVDEAAHLPFAHLASLRDPGDKLLIEVAVQRLRHLSVLGREGVLGVEVRGGLELARMQHVRMGPDQVERVAEEQLVARDPHEIQWARRGEIDAVCRRGHVVLLASAVFEIRDNRLA